MLSDIDLIQLIDSDEIGLSYTFLPDPLGVFMRQPRELKPATDVSAKAFLTDHTVRSRVALTLGPLVKPVASNQPIRKANRFVGHSRIVDLRYCSDGWALAPKQSAVVCTNEHLKLPHDITAYILGRVSSYNNGLVTETSFLDSGWNGIVKLLLVNVSQKPVRLHLGMEVGRLFFERTPNASMDTSAVGTQSVHYGMTWSRILDDRIDPFPQSPTPPGARLRLTIANANDVLQRYAGIGLLALAISALIGGVRLYDEMGNALSQGSLIQSLGQQVAAIRSAAPLTGVAEVTIVPGESHGASVVKLPTGILYRGTSSIGLAELRDAPDGATASASISQDQEGVAVQLSVNLVSPTRVDTSVTVLWVYLP